MVRMPQFWLALLITLALSPVPARASIITLTFQSAATGSNLPSTPLVTALGTITASESGGGTLSFVNFLGQYPSLLHRSDTDGFAQLAFDFDVTSVSFLVAADGGSLTAQVLDGSFNEIDSIFIGDTSTPNDPNGVFFGPISLAGPGIRYLRFGDYPSPTAASLIDNLEISNDPVPVPEPATLTLLGLGTLATAGARRWQRRRTSTL